MPSDRRLDEIIRNLSEPKRHASDYATVYHVYDGYADIRMGNSPTLLKNVPIQGDKDTIRPGDKVRVEWAERDGTVGKAPYISGAGGTYLSGGGGIATVTVDNVTIEKQYVGLAVKKGGLGLQHLNFKPSMDGHIHKSPWELGGWKFTDDGIVFTDKMYIHPQGMLKIGGGYPNEDDIIILDSQDATYRLWAGNQSAASAPFSVSKAGAIKSTSGEIAGWTIDSTKIAGGGIEMYSAGYIQSNPFTSGLVGFRIDDDVAEFNNVRVRGELHSAVFVYDEIHATSGTLGVFPSAGVLLNDVTTSGGSFNVDIKDPDSGHAQLFSTGDRLRIKDGSGGDNWVQISSVSDQTTFYRYVCTKNSGSDTTFRAGATVVSYGQSGDGNITLSADGTVGSSPNISLQTHTGSPWTTQELIMRLGNLNGSYGYTSDVYGLGLGDINGNYLKYDTTTGQLYIKGSVVIGDHSGYAVDPVLHLDFDGPYPLHANFATQLVSHDGRSPANATGVCGRPGKYHKGATLGRAETNLITNPSAEVDTTGWTKHANLLTFERITTDSAVGEACFHLYESSSTGSNEHIESTDYITVTAATSYAISCYVKQYLYDSGDYGQIIIDWYNSSYSLLSSSTLNFDVDDYDWKRFEDVFTSPSTAAYAKIRINMRLDSSDLSHLYVDGIQFEAGTTTSEYFDGSMGPGYAWTGTEHASTSTRAAGRLDYELDRDNTLFTEGTINVWVYYPGYLVNLGGGVIAQLYSDAGDHIRLYTNDASNNAKMLTTSSLGSDPPSTIGALSTGWNMLTCTWKSGGNQVVFLNGVQKDSDSFVLPDGYPLYLAIGSEYGSSTRPGHVFDEFTLLDYQMDPDEVELLYDSGRALATTNKNFSLVMSEANKGMILGNASGIYGYDPVGDLGFSLTNDGEILAGGGDVILDKYGITMNATTVGSETSKQFELKYNNDTLGYIEAYYSVAAGHYFRMVAQDAGGKGTDLVFQAQSNIRLEPGSSLPVKIGSTNYLLLPGTGVLYGINWGSSADVNLYRNGANELRTSDTLIVDTALRVGGASSSPTSGIASSGDITAGGGVGAGNTGTSIYDGTFTMAERTADPATQSNNAILYSLNNGHLYLWNDSGVKIPVTARITLPLHAGRQLGAGIASIRSYHEMMQCDASNWDSTKWSFRISPGMAGKEWRFRWSWFQTSGGTGNIVFAIEIVQRRDGQTAPSSATHAWSTTVSAGSQNVAYTEEINGDVTSFNEGDHITLALVRYGPNGSDTYPYDVHVGGLEIVSIQA